MAATRKYRQLQLVLDATPRQAAPVFLSFPLHRRPVKGILHGSPANWTFESESPVFLQHIPSGRLDKYALWTNRVPTVISELYQKIYEASQKAGYPLQEREEI